MVRTSALSKDQIWDWLDAVPDPEIPVISVVDLGVVRDVVVSGEGVEVTITPTYTGCPAMSMIAFDIEMALAKKVWKKSPLRRKLLRHGPQIG